MANNNIFYEDRILDESRVTWRCSKFYTRFPNRDRCQVSIALRAGNVSCIKGEHNHPESYSESKHASRRCEVDWSGKYKITGQWAPKPIRISLENRQVKKSSLAIKKKKDNKIDIGEVHYWHVPTFY